MGEGSDTASTLQAGCLCGAVVFSFTPLEHTAMNCYCSLCRGSHGADYATQVPASKRSLQVVSGQDKLKEYPSSAYGIRAFCTDCGSRLMNYASVGSDYMSVALAAVEAGHGIQPSMNLQVASKADWVEPSPHVPSYPEFPPDIGKYLK